MIREDLLALTPDALAAIANVGLVKRAQREAAEGQAPAIAIEADGTVVGTFEGGTVARLVPRKSLHECPCTCGAISVCRHRVATALAYPEWHRLHAATANDPAVHHGEWSPAEIDDEHLAAYAGKRLLDRARAAVRDGIVVTVLPPVETERPATARLPTCTVRFHVPRDLNYARCDCAATGACEHVVLAVWAFRKANEDTLPTESRTIALGHAGTGTEGEAAGLTQAVDVAREVARFGIANGGLVLGEKTARARAALERERLVWPLDAVEDLERMIEAYAARSASYDERRAARILADLVARERAARTGGELPARFILGEGEASETLLDHVRLVSLGARMRADGRTRSVQIFLAERDSGNVLVYEKSFAFGEEDTPLEGPALAKRAAIPGLTIAALGAGQIVTRAAKRRANGRVAFGASRGQTSVTPQRGEWATFPAPLRFAAYRELEEYLRKQAPRALRPRHLAEGFHVVSIASVDEVAYVASEQRIVVAVRDERGDSLFLERTHSSVAPFAIDSMAHAVEVGLAHAAGPVSRRRHGLVLEPLSIVSHDGVIVPDLAAAPIAHRAARVIARPATDAIADALEAAELTVAEGAHLGLARASASFPDRVRSSAGRLSAVGLNGLATLGTAFAESVGSPGAVDRFFDFAIALELARELS